VVEMKEVITLSENLSETSVNVAEPIAQTGEMTATSMTTKKRKKQEEKSSILNLTTTLDGIDIEKEFEIVEFDDYSEVDYDMDYTSQY
jgi:flagellar assembly factor FliW